jgi:hypothetical protein
MVFERVLNVWPVLYEFFMVFGHYQYKNYKINLKYSTFQGWPRLDLSEKLKK